MISNISSCKISKYIKYFVYLISNFFISLTTITIYFVYNLTSFFVYPLE
nr:MAG TPA: hypothetical protein [Caudoviricetes sp.]